MALWNLRQQTGGAKPKGKPVDRNGKVREKCKAPGNCPAMADPSGTGFCSWHNSQALNVGEKVEVLKHDRKCGQCGGLCKPPRPGEDEQETCDSCTEHLSDASELLPELGEEPMSHPAKAGIGQAPIESDAARAARLHAEELEYRKRVVKGKPVSKLARFL